MHSKQQSCNAFSRTISHPANALVMVIVLGLTFACSHSLPAQTYKVIHKFTGGRDGTTPCAGLTIDNEGNLYGTTSGTGGSCNAGASSGGTVFRLSKKGPGWVFSTLYTFRGDGDGADPLARVTIGPDGSLYGTTSGGGGNGCGTVFNLRPPAQVPPTVMGGWIETVLYRFAGNEDGCWPSGDLVFDHAGNIYGTTIQGGSQNAGSVYELMYSPGGWTEAVLHSFNGADGAQPWYSGLIFDKTGNLYGSTVYGGTSGCMFGPCGNVFQLTPSESGWTEHDVYDFQGQNDGGQPVGTLVFDQRGYLYGTTAADGTIGGGTAFLLTPYGGSWNFSVLHSLTGDQFEGPWAGLAIDAAGNLYGTTFQEGADKQGSVFQITVSCGCAGCSYTYHQLYDFTGGSGANPISTLVFDQTGNVFGTTSRGGTHSHGVVFQLTPALSSPVESADSSSCTESH